MFVRWAGMFSGTKWERLLTSYWHDNGLFKSLVLGLVKDPADNGHSDWCQCLDPRCGPQWSQLFPERKVTEWSVLYDLLEE